MSLKIVANTFYKSKEKLSTSEARRVDAFIQKIESNRESNSLGLEKIKKSSDPNYWSARVNKDLRVILHVENDTYTILYVDHHDSAYQWANNHKLSKHRITGALQVVRLPETVEEPLPGREKRDDPEIAGTQIQETFSSLDFDFFASLGVPDEWIAFVKAIKTEKDLWKVIDNLPEEAGERIYDLALGLEPEIPKKPTARSIQEIETPDQRNMVRAEDEDELIKLLSGPIEEWMIYLHPAQRHLAEEQFKGPVKISGSAGTGKTVVAIHRAKNWASEGKRVLLTTFTRALTEDIRKRIELLASEDQKSLITISTVHKLTTDLLRMANIYRSPLVGKKNKDLFETNKSKIPKKFEKRFVFNEWNDLIAKQGIDSESEYFATSRVGRGVPLAESERKKLWPFFDRLLKESEKKKRLPFGHLCKRARLAVERGEIESMFDAVVIDEVQDLSTQEILLLSSLVNDKSNLFLIGDTGQRIYSGGFSLRSMGIETRGRSTSLKINYRTTRKIAHTAGKIRAKSVDDMDGESVIENGVKHIRNGEFPEFKAFEENKEEIKGVSELIHKLVDAEGISPGSIGVFARTKRLCNWIRDTLNQYGIPAHQRTRNDIVTNGNAVYIGTMHSAKGQEFPNVFVIGVNDKNVPLKASLKEADSDEDRSAIMERERTLLYVAMTRARDNLHVSWGGEPSPFLAGFLDV